MSRTGTIFDIVNRAKQMAPNDIEKQTQYIQIGVELIKRDYPDMIRSFSSKYEGYDVNVTMFPNDGMVVSWWQMKLNMLNMAAGLEYMNPSTKESRLVFCSSPYIVNQPLLPKLLLHE